MLNPDDSILHKLEALVAAGERQRDPAQFAIARRLDSLTANLLASRPSRKTNALGWLFAARKKDQPPVKGLYIHGGVGRGKTMLMDMFFDAVPIQRKRRAHFHEFMADVHERIYRHRQKLKNGETKQADPIPPVASDLFGEARLLCFDEFTVTDIADAMILARLFGELFAKGCVLVATSNVEPDNLYRDGLNRGLFLPFIDLLKANAEIISLDTETDYRLGKTDGAPVWLSPLGPETEAAMDRAWYRETAGRAARFTFADLCAQPLGAADYLAIVAQYSTIFLDHVPHLGPHLRNETKRFIILVDALYDQGARLFASAAAEPQHLLTARKGTEGFEFDRTVSRLIEMQSQEYAAAHPQNSAAE